MPAHTKKIARQRAAKSAGLTALSVLALWAGTRLFGSVGVAAQVNPCSGFEMRVEALTTRMVVLHVCGVVPLSGVVGFRYDFVVRVTPALSIMVQRESR